MLCICFRMNSEFSDVTAIYVILKVKYSGSYLVWVWARILAGWRWNLWLDILYTQFQHCYCILPNHPCLFSYTLNNFNQFHTLFRISLYAHFAKFTISCRRTSIILFLNLLKPTGHVMHQQFNIQQLYVLPTLYLCVLCLSENKQRLVPLTA